MTTQAALMPCEAWLPRPNLSFQAPRLWVPSSALLSRGLGPVLTLTGASQTLKTHLPAPQI